MPFNRMDGNTGGGTKRPGIIRGVTVPYNTNLSLQKGHAPTGGGTRPAAAHYSPAARQPSYTPSYGGEGGGGAAAMSAVAPTPAAPSEQDYLAGDSAYQAQLAALTKALADYQADQTNQNSQYDTQYNQGLASLGYLAPPPDAGGGADPSAQGGWNFQDLNTSAGRSYDNQLNDFASRGELQSSGYGTALDNLTRSLNTQKGSMDTSRQGFEDNLASQLAQQQNANTLSIQQAKADAIARRAQQYAL